MIAQAAFAVLVYTGFVLHASAGTWGLSPAVVPAFLPLAAAVCCLHGGPCAAFVWGAMLGLCWDALSPAPAGTHVLGLVVLIAAARLLTSRTLGRSFVGSTVFVASFVGVAALADRLHRHLVIVPAEKVENLSQDLMLDASRTAAAMLVYAGVRGVWQVGRRLVRARPRRAAARSSGLRWAR